MTSAGDTTGLILAGGAGRRVEGRDKGLVNWRGLTLIEHVMARLLPQVDALLISCNRNEERYAQFGPVVAGDTRHGYQGPLAGIESAEPEIHSDLVLVVPCDMPLLPADLALRLSAALRNEAHSCDISFAHDGDREQYLCALIRTSCLHSLTPFLDTGNRAVHRWFESQRTVCVDFSDQKSSFQNFNTLDG